MHLVAGWPDIGDSIRQLRLRHRQRIEGFAQQLDLTSLCHQVPSEQLMESSPGRSGARVRHILGERLFRRLDEDVDIVRGEREVRIEFEQSLKQGGDLDGGRYSEVRPRASAGTAARTPRRPQTMTQRVPDHGSKRDNPTAELSSLSSTSPLCGVSNEPSGPGGSGHGFDLHGHLWDPPLSLSKRRGSGRTWPIASTPGRWLQR